jgi:hypothetical protein
LEQSQQDFWKKGPLQKVLLHQLLEGSQVNSHPKEWKQNHQVVGWRLFKWRRFMNMVTSGEQGKVKKRYLDLAYARK